MWNTELIVRFGTTPLLLFIQSNLTKGWHILGPQFCATRMGRAPLFIPRNERPKNTLEEEVGPLHQVDSTDIIKAKGFTFHGAPE